MEEEVEEQKESSDIIVEKEELKEETNSKSHISPVPVTIVQKSPEDIFVDKWIGFEWKKMLSQIPMHNLSAVIKNTNEFVN